MRFMMFMIPDVYKRPTPADFMPSAEEIATMEKFNHEMGAAGILVDLAGLTPPSEAVQVSFKGGKPLVTDGPFAETKEVVGGYWLIEVASRDEAVSWAKRIPAGENDVVEVRQLFWMPDEPADQAKA